ncbi:MAG: FAD-binding oxidoreductase [Leptolyngbyaceae cyanobacterium SL_1_1]|nr:FAD-binding oxidoreductase [Leptolyngbyaceae cyanobacterium RM1_1_2]NJO11154.1 FAD-binding oxidoreductase [Leptolyngbyaceae cyanobacterium SL_1_1]
MKTYDWIVVGNGLAGAALSYELARQGAAVLLIDRALDPPSATRFSYGGIPYWSGTTALTQQLCREGIERYRQFSQELEADTQFRELDLILTVEPGADPEAIAQQYQKFEIVPQLISPAEAHQLEPQLDPDAIAGALSVRHGHVEPMALVAAYNQAFHRSGGDRFIAEVTGLVRIGDRVTGVTTPQQAYAAANVVVAAGGLSRQLLQKSGIVVPIYFTQAELIETPAVDFKLRSLVMPANLRRFELERLASQPDTEALWQEPGHQIAAAILDAGVVQLLDGRLRIGQISRLLTSPQPPVYSASSEASIRAATALLLPALAAVPGRWHQCLVSFSRDGVPLAGPVPGIKGLLVFAGFGGPFAILPPTATRFAHWLTGKADPLIEQMQLSRFKHGLQVAV